MIELFGLEGYTGRRVAPEWMIEEQRLLWLAEHLPQQQAVDGDIAQLQAEAERMGLG
jgi:hypothetical protein